MFIDYFMIVLPHQFYDNKFKIKCQALNPLFSNSHFEKNKIGSESRIRRIALISRILVTLIIENNLIRAIF